MGARYYHSWYAHLAQDDLRKARLNYFYGNGSKI